LEDLGADDAVEGVVRERQAQGVAVDAGAEGPERGLAGVLHGPEQVPHRRQLVEAVVERDDLRAAAEALEGVPAGACAHVELQVAALQAEEVEVDGQHRLSLRSGWWPRRRRGGRTPLAGPGWARRASRRSVAMFSCVFPGAGRHA